MATGWLPAPWLSVGLLLLWLLLNRSLGLGNWLLGTALAWIIPFAVAPLRPDPPLRVRLSWAALRLIGVVLWDLFMSSWAVARGVLRGRAPHSRWVTLPLDLTDRYGLVALSVIMCLTPDTLWAGLSPDGRSLKIHVFDLPDETGYVNSLKHRYEQPLMEIFES